MEEWVEKHFGKVYIKTKGFSQTGGTMGFFDLFKKKRPDDGTYHRPEGAEPCYGGGGAADSFGTFRITVEDVFTITGRGTVITGKVESGTVTVGDQVTLRRVDGSTREVTVAGLEMFRKMLNTAEQGDNVGLLLRGVTKSDVGRGDVLEKGWQ